MASNKLKKQSAQNWTVVVAHMVEESLPSQEVRGLNPVIYIIKQYSTNCNLAKTKMTKKVKEAGNCQPSTKPIQLRSIAKVLFSNNFTANSRARLPVTEFSYPKHSTTAPPISPGSFLMFLFLAFFSVRPESKPQIYGLRHEYSSDEIIDVLCTSKRSFPAAKIDFFINDEAVSRVKSREAEGPLIDRMSNWSNVAWVEYETDQMWRWYNL